MVPFALSHGLTRANLLPLPLQQPRSEGVPQTLKPSTPSHLSPQLFFPLPAPPQKSPETKAHPV
jgi:hypothetical protein